MSEIKVGEYARFKVNNRFYVGIIDKVKDDKVFISYCWINKSEIKHSDNLADLLEVGDIVHMDGIDTPAKDIEFNVKDEDCLRIIKDWIKQGYDKIVGIELHENRVRQEVGE